MKNIKNKLIRGGVFLRWGIGGVLMPAIIDAGEIPKDISPKMDSSVNYGFPTEQVSADYFPSKENKKRESMEYPILNQEAILNENKYIIERGFK